MKFKKGPKGDYRVVGMGYEHIRMLDMALSNHIDKLRKDREDNAYLPPDVRVRREAEWDAAGEMLNGVIGVRRGDLEDL